MCNVLENPQGKKEVTQEPYCAPIPVDDMEKIRANLEVSREYEWIFRICVACKSLYFSQRPEDLFLFKQLGALEKKILAKAIAYLNNVAIPTLPQDLYKAKIKDLSGSYCCFCFASINRLGGSIRRGQEKEGYTPCFGSAVSNCPYKNCAHYNLCVVDPESLKAWRKRVQYLRSQGLLLDFDLSHR